MKIYNLNAGRRQVCDLASSSRIRQKRVLRRQVWRYPENGGRENPQKSSI